MATLDLYRSLNKQAWRHWSYLHLREYFAESFEQTETLPKDCLYFTLLGPVFDETGQKDPSLEFSWATQFMSPKQIVTVEEDPSIQAQHRRLEKTVGIKALSGDFVTRLEKYMRNSRMRHVKSVVINFDSTSVASTWTKEAWLPRICRTVKHVPQVAIIANVIEYSRRCENRGLVTRKDDVRTLLTQDAAMIPHLTRQGGRFELQGLHRYQGNPIDRPGHQESSAMCSLFFAARPKKPARRFALTSRGEYRVAA